MTQPVARQSTAAVPMPGPAADAPPPWNRVPGQEPSPVLVETGPLEAGGRGSRRPHRLPRPARATAAERPHAGPTLGRRAAVPRRPHPAAPAGLLQLKRLDPWSVLKLALVLAVVLFLIWLVAVGVLYGVLDGMGVWDRLNGTYADLVSGEAPAAAS